MDLLEACLALSRCSVKVGHSYVSKGCPRHAVKKIQVRCIFEHNLLVVISLTFRGYALLGTANNPMHCCSLFNTEQQTLCSLTSLRSPHMGWDRWGQSVERREDRGACISGLGPSASLTELFPRHVTHPVFPLEA